MLPLPRKRPNSKRRGPHPDRALSASFCRNVGEAGRYCDGNGLYLHVEASGSRRWVQRLVIRGKSYTLGLGSCRLVSLAEARERALTNRKIARSGGDPLADRRRANGAPTFAEVAEKVIAIHSEIWKQPGKTRRQWQACLRDHAYPHTHESGRTFTTSRTRPAPVQCVRVRRGVGRTPSTRGCRQVPATGSPAARSPACRRRPTCQEHARRQVGGS